MSPLNKVLLNIFQSTIGRNEKIALFIKDKLRDLLITDKLISRIEYKREIIIEEKKISVVDTIISNSLKVDQVVLQTKAAYIFVPSSRYFKKSDIANDIIKIKPNISKSISITRIFQKNGEIKMNSVVKNE